MSKTLYDLIDKMTDSQKIEFSLDCAERVPYIFEERYSNDYRPREAIASARRYIKHKNEPQVSLDFLHIYPTSQSVGYALQCIVWAVAAAYDHFVVLRGMPERIAFEAQAAKREAGYEIASGTLDTMRNKPAAALEAMEKERDWQRQRAIAILGGASDE